jgi:hypothetical protein
VVGITNPYKRPHNHAPPDYYEMWREKPVDHGRSLEITPWNSKIHECFHIQEGYVPKLPG